MNHKLIACITELSIMVVLNSCGIIRQSPKTSFVDGLYSQKTEHTKQKVYVDVDEDELTVYTTSGSGRKLVVDTTSGIRYSASLRSNVLKKSNFSKYSYDIDFITIPLKYRFGTAGVPQQLNANINGAIYLGYRTDRYVVRYQPNALGQAVKRITHYGFSFGICTGIGNTDMNATNTANLLAKEYDGLVWNKGLTGIIAIDNFTIGLVFGFDNLLDKNHTIWIYENKPWIGLGFGLNLN
jgi:hypothetical protein